MTDVSTTERPTWLDRPEVVLVGCAVTYLPFTLLGFGTDIDVPNVLRSGRAFVEDGRYEASRRPGAVVHEVATGVLEWLGGSVLVNLSSLAFALLCLWCVHELLRREEARWPTGAMLVLAANPWFWTAATALGDFTWALGLALGGALASQRRRPVVAGVLFALAIGCRASSVLLLLAWLFAQGTGTRDDRPSTRETLQTLVVAGSLALLLFLPPLLEADSGGLGVDHLDFTGFGAHLGRWVTKNVALVGVIPGVVLLVGLPRVIGAFGRWSTSSVVRFATAVLVLTQVLFFRFPFKPLHLLPAVAAVVLLIGSAPAVSRRWIGALVVAQLVGGLVGSTIAAPDVVDDARGGSIELGITAGPLVTDVGCRLDDREQGPWRDPGSGAAQARAAKNAACAAESWRAPAPSPAP